MTGVDVVEKGIVHGDVTALRDADVGSGFRLVLDTASVGCRGANGPSVQPHASLGERVLAAHRAE